MIDEDRLLKAVEHAQWVLENVGPDTDTEALQEAVDDGELTPEQKTDLEGYLAGCMGCSTCTVRTVMDAMWSELYSLIAGDIADRLEMDALGFENKAMAAGVSAVAKIVRQQKADE